MIAYLDLAGGLAGDIFLACFLDAGVQVTELVPILRALPLENWSLEEEEIQAFGLKSRRIVFHVSHHHRERSFPTIRDQIIQPAELPARVKELALVAFEALARAEAKVHGLPIEKVHFHEVGADDSILDLVGAAACLELAKVSQLFASPIPLGRGVGRCRHGLLPLPAPATVELLKGKPVFGLKTSQETVTPTGAAILSWADGFGEMPPMRLVASGSGTGQHPLEEGLTRLFLGEPGPASARLATETISVLTTTIDDMNPELYGPLLDRLLAAGALDVVLIPVQMKKNRPGVRLEVLCLPHKASSLAEMVLEETTSLGIRLKSESRLILERRPGRVMVDGVEVGGKWIRRPSGRLEFRPEFADCQALAGATGRPVGLIYELALRAAGPAPED